MNNMQSVIERKQVAKLAAPRFVASLKAGRLDEAQANYDLLCTLLSEDDLLTFKVFLTIQRGRVWDALHLINSLPADRCPELKVICLKLLNDPTWHSQAQMLLDSPDPSVRKAMRQLLQLPLETAQQGH